MRSDSASWLSQNATDVAVVHRLALDAISLRCVDRCDWMLTVDGGRRGRRIRVEVKWDLNRGYACCTHFELAPTGRVWWPNLTSDTDRQMFLTRPTDVNSNDVSSWISGQNVEEMFEVECVSRILELARGGQS